MAAIKQDDQLIGGCTLVVGLSLGNRCHRIFVTCSFQTIVVPIGQTQSCNVLTNVARLVIK